MLNIAQYVGVRENPIVEEHESEVLQVECRIECSLVGEQEQRHSAGTDS